ncbi:MAG: DNA primase [Chitinivibrionales bacterium]|nr:DNA primase [Chitinivibrionales bacterium]
MNASHTSSADRDKEEVRARTDIAEVVGRYVKLKPAGRNLKGLCPFHKEKTPSFIVTPDRGTFHCFGCGKGGDVFTFLEEAEGLGFKEALHMLAEEAGVRLTNRPERPAAQQQTDFPPKTEMLRIHALAMDFYYRNIRGEQRAVEYFKSRGLQAETVRDFKLGYAPPGWSNLIDFLKGKGIAESAVEACGLALRKDQGRPYDRFRDRIIFTLFDPAGRAIGFAGRGMEKDAQPKYLNSPETPIYRKSRTLYGLHKALPFIKEQDTVIVVEGYMDFLSLYEAGVRNVVATSGTALTADHAHMLRRFAPRVMLVFDGDAAGVQAAERGVAVLAPVGLDVRVMILPNDDDPDSYVRREGAEAFTALLGRAQDGLQFVLERAVEAHGTESAAQKSAVLGQLQPLLSDISDSIIRDDFARHIADRLHVAERLVLERIRPARRERESAEAAAPAPQSRSYASSLEGHFIHLIVSHPELVPEAAEYVPPDTLTDRFSNELYCSVLGAFQRDPSLGSLLDSVEGPEATQTVAALIALPEPSEQPHEELAHTIIELQKKYVRYRLKQIRLALQKAPRDRALLKEHKEFALKLRDLTMGQA